MSAGVLGIKLRCSSWQQLSMIYKRDLARNAMFLKSGTPPPIGTQVRIDLTLPSGSSLALSGVISMHVPEGGLGGRGPGVDVKLAPIPPSAMWMIETALKSEPSQKPTTSETPAVSPRAGTSPGTPAAPLPKQPAMIPVATEPGIDGGAELAEAEGELVRALTSEAASLRKLNPFHVLGVGYEAGDAEVRAAFGELTKRYHPDRFARYSSTELRALAAEIFIVIRDSYRKLVDEAGRTAALASIGKTGAPRAIAAPQRNSGSQPAARPVAVPPPPVRAGTAPVRASTEPTPRAVMVPTKTQPGVSTQSVAAIPEPPPSAAAAKSPKDAPSQPRFDGKGFPASPPATQPGGVDISAELTAAEALLDEQRFDDAQGAFKTLLKKYPSDRGARAGIELCLGYKALASRDRLEAAQRFEAVLEIDPSNERAARELADMRRQATNERKGLLTRLMGKKE